MDKNIEKLFIEILGVTVGTKNMLSCTPTSEQWEQLYQISSEHKLVGVIFSAITRLQPQTKTLPQELYLKWMGIAAKVQQRNELMNKHCTYLMSLLASEGLSGCIIKGQTIASYYGSISKLRQSGDIDLWIDASVKDIQKWILKFHQLQHFDYMHTHLRLFVDAEVEVHYRPMISRNLVRNALLQKLTNKYNSQTFRKNKLLNWNVPDPTFHVILILHHIYWHLHVEGVGIRQLMDLYYILRTKDYDKDTILVIIEKLGLTSFVKELMWVLIYLFDRPCLAVNGCNYSNTWVLCTPNEKGGRFLVEEIFRSGNFGQSDSRIIRVQRANKFAIVGSWLFRELYLVWHYPKDVLWTLPGIAYHSIYRRINYS